MASKSLEQLMLYAIGGGWGDEQPGAGKVRVAVIRGTDIPRLRTGDHSSVPFRYESESKVRSRLLRDGDIVIEVSGGSAASGQHTGRSLLVTGEILQSLGGKVIPASFCRLLRLDTQQVHPGFVILQIDSLHRSGEIAEFENQSTGIANFQFNRFVAEAYPIIKELDAQKTIAEYVSSFDRLIALNRRINQTLEAMAQAIFKSWFVDFDPVKAKIAAIEQGKDPLRAAMRAISGKTDAELDQMPREHHDQLAATAALFPDAMEASELGEIPKGWEVSDFGSVSVCFDKNRIPLSKRQREDKKGNIPYYGATSVMDYVDEHIFDGVFLLLGEDGSVLREDGTPFVQYIWGKSWVNNHAHVLQGANGVSTEQLMLFISMQNISAYVTGAVQLKLNQKNMNSIPFIKAEENVNSRFSELMTPLYAKYRSLFEEIRGLTELRDSLLPKLLSGELSVDDLTAENL